MLNFFLKTLPLCLFILLSNVICSLADTTVGGVISSDTTWTISGSPYNVTSTVQVYGTSTTPVTLTIEPGVVVKFASNAGLQIGNGTSQGALIAQGTAANRITFTRSAASGAWGNITFNDGTVDATTALENIDIQYSASITATSCSPTIRNSTITNVTGYGLNLTTANPIIDTVTIASTGSYGMYLSSSSPTITNSTITSTGTYGIYLSSSSPTITGGSLTNLSATGQGIYGSGSPVISNFTISSANSAGIYGLYLSSTTSALSVMNSTISNGLYIGSTAITPTITGNTFTNLDNSPIHAGANIISQILDNNTLTGLSSAGKVEVIGEVINRTTTWKQLIAPYVVSGTVSVYNTPTAVAALTIAPGTTVKFASNTGLQIGYNTNQGALIAQGTAANRITFTRSGTSGTWSGVSFLAGTVNATLLENVDIQYSTGITVTSCSPTIRNSTITNVTGNGLYLTTANPIIDTVTIASTGSYGMYLSSSSPTITNSTITSTGTYGIYLSSSSPTITNATITNTGTYGIYLGSSSPIITGGSLTNLSATGQGIYGSGSPVISNYTVSSANNPGIYGLYLSSTTSALSVMNSTISNGLYIGSTAIVPTITGNTFGNLDNSPLHAGANIISQLVAGNTLTGLSSAGKVEVIGEVVNRNTTWNQLIAPYVVVSGTVSVYNTAAAAATLTIAPGTMVKFAPNTGLQIGYNTNQGALIAQGTAANRITFTRSGTSGTWSGMSFLAGTVNTTTLENVDIQYSTGITITSCSPTIRNSTITNVPGNGLRLTTANPIIDTVTVTSTATAGMYLSSSSPTITNSTITNTGTYGIYLDSSSPIVTGGSLTNLSATGHGIYGSGSPVISNYTVSSANSAGIYGLYLSSTTSVLSVINSIIGNGLYIGTTAIVPTITGNTFTNLDNSPIHAGANIIGQITTDNTLTGLSSAGKVEVIGEVVNRTTTWNQLIAPYVVVSGTVSVYNTAAAATLTVAPGTIIKFASGTGLQIGYNNNQGALVAQGTAANRITFTRSGTAGTWSGISFLAGTVNTTTLENVDIQYSSGITATSCSPTIRNSTMTDMAGYLSLTNSNPVLENVIISTNSTYGMYLSSASPAITDGSLTNSNATGYGIYGSGSPVISSYSVTMVNSSAKYGLYLTSSTSALSVTNSTIGNGLYLGATGITPTITGNTFTNSDNLPPHAGAIIISQILDSNIFNGLTAAGKLEVVAEQINRDVRWKKYVAPYVVQSSFYVYKDTTSASTLTIDPGVTVKFALNTALYVGSGASKGVLSANGTAALPITFTSNQATPAAGNWSGLNFNGDAASASTLNNIIVEYGGYGGTYSSANISLSSSSPTIRSATIRNSAGSGIYLSSATAIPKVLDSTITSNKWGVYVNNSNPLISNSKVFSNSTAGVWNTSTTADMDARGNWWGATSGPAHASNPSGTGNAVSNKVLFNPWLGQVPGNLSIVNCSITPATFNLTGDYATISASISASANWKITITDSTGSAVRTFTGSGVLINQVWSGENNANAKVADGTYSVLIEATDINANIATPILGTIKVASSIPIAIINYPSDNLMFLGGTTIDIYATAIDAIDFKNYTLEYGTGEAPISWSFFVATTTTQPTNTKIYSWNTNGYTSGIYTLRLTATDNAGNIQMKTVRVRLLWVSASANTENYISPNGDGIKDSTIISATSTNPADWSIAIANSDNVVVSTLTTMNSSTLSQAWDGKDTAGAVVPDGTYTYKIIAIDPVSGAQSTPKTGTVISDRTAPTVTIAAPLPGGLLRNSITVTGTVLDTNISSYTLDFGPSDGNGPWKNINSGTTAVPSSALGTWITNDEGSTVPLANGSYLLRLMAADKAGNNASSTIPVTVDNLILSNVTASSHSIDTNNSQTSTIQYSINAPARVIFKVIPEKLGITGAAVYQASMSVTAAGSYSFVWDGKDNNSKVVSDEAYIYVLTASDDIRSDSYAPTPPNGTGSITCSQSEYNPIMNLPMTVTYVPTVPSRVTLDISWGTQNFKVMDAVPSLASTGVFNWIGMNPSQTILANGASALCTIASLLPENHIITTGNTPWVTMLKTDPYQISLAYGQLSRIKFTLSRQSNITIKLVSPSGATTTLVDNLLHEASSYEVEWTSADLNDTNGKTLLIAEEGDYAVNILAINPTTGASSTTKGNLRVGL